MILLTLLGVGALAEPQLQVLLDGQEVEGATLSEEEGAFQVSLPESLRAMQKAGGADQARLEIILDGVSTGSYPLRQLEHLFSESEPPQSIGTARLKTHALLREGKAMLEDEGATSATMEKLKEAADLGSVEAMLTLGNTHLTGTDILPRNWKLAMGWLDKAQSVGHGEAQAQMAMLQSSKVMEGFGEAPLKSEDDKLSLVNWLFAAESQSSYAQMALGWMYSYGVGVEENLEIASDYYEKAAERLLNEVGHAADDLYADRELLEIKNYTASQSMSTTMEDLAEEEEEEEPEVIENTREQIEYTESEAKGGNPESNYVLGTLAATGQGGVKKDTEKAKQYLKDAITHAKADVASNSKGKNAMNTMDNKEIMQEAHFNLGYMEMQSGNNTAAIENWERSAGGEKTGAGSLNSIGNLFYRGGNGITKNYTKAIENFERAAQRGSVHAMVNLARMHLEGQGTPRSPAKAMDIYRVCAVRGNAEASLFMAAMSKSYLSGGRPDHALAVQYLKPLCENLALGDAVREGKLAFEKGLAGEAMLWYLQAAWGGMAAAQINVARLYEVLRDKALVDGDQATAERYRNSSFFYYKLAARQGCVDAQMSETKVPHGEVDAFSGKTSWQWADQEDGDVILEYLINGDMLDAEALFNLGDAVEKGLLGAPQSAQGAQHLRQLAKETGKARPTTRKPSKEVATKQGRKDGLLVRLVKKVAQKVITKLNEWKSKH